MVSEVAGNECMKVAKYGFLIGALVMGYSIVYGFAAGDFLGDGSALIGLLWGKITLIDIYLAFFVFAAWMFFREGFNVKSSVIFMLIVVFGSFTICFYTYIAMHRAGGAWQRFRYGRRLVK